MSAFALLLLAALPVRAQFADPTVWVSTSSGVLPWVASPRDAGERDNVMHNFSVNVASRRWMVQGGGQISGYVHPFGGDPLQSLSDNTAMQPVSYRTVYAVGGPWTTSRWFMAAAALGPAVTWGTAARVDQSGCPDTGYCTADLRTQRSYYFNPGFAGSVQGFVRLDGRLWIGGETMAVVNKSSSHLVTRLAVRVDLLRPDR